jgi:hypothetical protein
MRAIVIAAFAIFAACAWDNASTLEKPVPGYPCGTGGHVCPGGGCCSNSEACGGTPGCPTGSCCFVGGSRRTSDAGLE